MISAASKFLSGSPSGNAAVKCFPGQRSGDCQKISPLRRKTERQHAAIREPYHVYPVPIHVEPGGHVLDGRGDEAVVVPSVAGEDVFMVLPPSRFRDAPENENTVRIRVAPPFRPVDDVTSKGTRISRCCVGKPFFT
jgi:hypothetical protein